MRSSGGTNFAPPVSVVVPTKSTMACLAGPSFHDGSGSWAWARVWPARAIASRVNVRRIDFMIWLWFCCRKKVFGFAGEFASRLVRDGPRVSQSNQAGSLGRMFSVSERPKALFFPPFLPLLAEAVAAALPRERF